MLPKLAFAQSSSPKYIQLQKSIDSLLYDDIKQVKPLIDLHEDYALSDRDTLQLMNALINRGDYYYESNDLSLSTKSYIDAAKFTNKGSDFNELRCHGYAYAAYNLMELELFEQAKGVAFSALNYSKKIADSSYLADCYSIIGASLFKTMNFEKSAVYFDSCLLVEKKLNDTIGILKVLNNLGRLNVASKFPKNAITFYKEALDLSLSINPKGANSSIIMSNLSDVYHNQGDLDQAALWLDKAINLLENNGNNPLICANFISLIRLYQNQGKRELASLTLDRMESNLSNCSNTTRVDFLIEKSKSHTLNKEYDDSAILLIEAKQLVKKFQITNREVSVLKAQYELYKSTGDNEKAIDINEIIITLEKKKAELEQTQKIAEVNAKYELDKKLQQITNLQDLQVKKDTTINSLQKSLWLILLLAFSIIILLSIFYFGRSNRQKQVIKSQKVKIDELSNELESIRSTIKKNVESGFRYQGKAPDLDTINTVIKTPLTPREHDILTALFEGKSNKEIASDLFLSINTVKFHLKNIYDKLGVKNRIQALKSITH